MVNMAYLYMHPNKMSHNIIIKGTYSYGVASDLSQMCEDIIMYVMYACNA